MLFKPSMGPPLPLLLFLVVLRPAWAATDFDKCLQAGAAKMASDYRTSVRYVDPWNEQPDSNPYPYKVYTSSRISPYYNIVTSPPKGIIAFRGRQTNDDCDLALTFTIDQKVTHANSYSLGFSEEFSVSHTVGVSIGIPEVASAKSETTFSFKVGATQTIEASDTSEWTVTQDVPTGPRSIKNVTIVVSEVKFTAKFDYYQDFTGMVPIWFKDRIDLRQAPPGNPWTCHPWTDEESQQLSSKSQKTVCEAVSGRKFTGGDNAKYPGCSTCWCCQPADLHWLWFINVNSVIDQGKAAGSSYCSGLDTWTANGATFGSTGSLNGVEGIDVSLVTDTVKMAPCASTASAALDSGTASQASVAKVSPTALHHFVYHVPHAEHKLHAPPRFMRGDAQKAGTVRSYPLSPHGVGAHSRVFPGRG